MSGPAKAHSGANPAKSHSGAKKRDDGPAVDQLSFLDLLYAVPVGDLAVRVSGAELGRVSPADWSALAVILGVIVLSWIGLHKNRAAMAGEKHPHAHVGNIPFAGLRFVQFLIEVVIVGMYFAMGLTLKLPTTSNPATPLPSEGWLTGFMLCIFASYLMWDAIDVQQSSHDPGWGDRARRGRRVTLIFLVPWAGFYLAVSFAHPIAVYLVVLVNLGLLILHYAYRVAQDWCGNTPNPGGWSCSASRSRRHRPIGHR